MLNCFGHPYGHYGYAVHTRNFFRALSRKIDLKLRPLNTNRSGFELDHEVARLVRRPLAIDFNKPQLGLTQPERLAELAGEPLIGYTVFEGTEFPAEQSRGLTTPDFLWVPSRWGKRVLVDQGIAAKNIDIIPEGINPEIYNSSVSPLEEYHEPETFTFLCVGKWEPRKGIKELLQVFSQVFDGREDVRLLLAAENPFHEVEPTEMISRMGLPARPEIVPVPQLPTAEAMAGLYRCADLFVLFTRAEGWGLPVMEAMACGVPPLVTNYGPMKDYLGKNYSFPVDPKKLEPIPESPSYPRGEEHGVWARPDYQRMAGVMEAVVEKEAELAKMGELAETKMHSGWTWEHAAEKAKRELENREVLFA